MGLELMESSLRTTPLTQSRRDLSQLQKLRLFKIKSEGYETFTTREVAEGKRLGEIKPCFLSPKDNWSQKFKGNYVEFQFISADRKFAGDIRACFLKTRPK
jgi:hypothetical protein